MADINFNATFTADETKELIPANAPKKTYVETIFISCKEANIISIYFGATRVKGPYYFGENSGTTLKFIGKKTAAGEAVSIKAVNAGTVTAEPEYRQG